MKKVLLGALVLFFGVILTACRFDKLAEDLDAMEEESEQIIRVYDADDKELFTITDDEVINVFSTYVSQEDVTDEEAFDIFKELPEDAKLAYRFESKLDEVPKANLYIYQNYDILSIKDLPVVGDINIPLTVEDAEWFRNPQEWQQ